MSATSFILETDGVVAGAARAAPAARALTLRLQPGKWARLTTESADSIPIWADVMLGLAEPAAGQVWFLGRHWRELGPDEQAALRARVGRVFSATAWLANLDVDENILLASRYHTRRPGAEWRREAEELARRLGLPGLPTGRPVGVPPDALQQAQWVRALLCAPRLLLLERPLHAAPAEAVARFGEALEEALGRGAAMIWFDLEGDTQPPSALQPPVVQAKI